MESPEIIKRAGDYLRNPLPKDNKKLLEHITGLESIRFELAEATVDTMRLLADKRKQMLWPKDVPIGKKEPTELDRSVYLNSDTATIERDYQFLIRIESLIEDRLNLAVRLLE